jgi:hypothetical protein
MHCGCPQVWTGTLYPGHIESARARILNRSVSYATLFVGLTRAHGVALQCLRLHVQRLSGMF